MLFHPFPQPRIEHETTLASYDKTFIVEMKEELTIGGTAQAYLTIHDRVSGGHTATTNEVEVFDAFSATTAAVSDQIRVYLDTELGAFVPLGKAGGVAIGLAMAGTTTGTGVPADVDTWLKPSGFTISDSTVFSAASAGAPTGYPSGGQGLQIDVDGTFLAIVTLTFHYQAINVLWDAQLAGAGVWAGVDFRLSYTRPFWHTFSLIAWNIAGGNIHAIDSSEAGAHQRALTDIRSSGVLDDYTKVVMVSYAMPFVVTSAPAQIDLLIQKQFGTQFGTIATLETCNFNVLKTG